MSSCVLGGQLRPPPPARPTAPGCWNLSGAQSPAQIRRPEHSVAATLSAGHWGPHGPAGGGGVRVGSALVPDPSGTPATLPLAFPPSRLIPARVTERLGPLSGSGRRTPASGAAGTRGHRDRGSREAPRGKAGDAPSRGRAPAVVRPCSSCSPRPPTRRRGRRSRLTCWPRWPAPPSAWSPSHRRAAPPGTATAARAEQSGRPPRPRPRRRGPIRARRTRLLASSTPRRALQSPHAVRSRRGGGRGWGEVGRGAESGPSQSGLFSSLGGARVREDGPRSFRPAGSPEGLGCRVVTRRGYQPATLLQEGLRIVAQERLNFSGKFWV